MQRDFDLKDEEIATMVAQAKAKIIAEGINISLGQISISRMEEAIDDVKDILWMCGGECVTSHEAVESLQADVDMLIVEIAILLYVREQITAAVD
jgi:hypothetical protein